MQPKRIVISLLVVILALFSAATVVSAEDSPTLDIAVEVSSSTALSDNLCTVEVGDVVTVSVTINENPGVAFATFRLKYDYDLMSPIMSESSPDTSPLECGTVFADATETVTVDSESIIYTADYHKNITATGTVFTCRFRVKAHGTAAIVLDMDEKDIYAVDANGIPVSNDPTVVSISYGSDANAKAGYAMVHDFGDPVKMDPTCTSNGKNIYTCTTCKETVSVDNGTPATGHTEVVIPSVSVTCSRDGMTEGKKCSVCNTVTMAPIVAVEKNSEYHVIVTDPAVAPTCAATGLTEGSHCSECELIMVAQQTIEKTEHSYGDWVVVTEATKDADGTRTKTCEACGDVVNESFPYEGGPSVVLIVIIVIAAILLIGGGAFCIYWFVFKKKKQVV